MINVEFKAKKTELETKYAYKIAGLGIANDVDKGVAFDMLAANVERGAQYKGAGECTTEEWAELIKDFADLKALARTV